MRGAILLAALIGGAAFAQGVPINPGPLPVLPTPPVYFDNSVICRNAANGTVCQLWLNRDGTYQAYFNRGTQTLKPSIDGPWQMEARDGRYSLRVRNGVTQVCLTPNSGAGGYDVERANELFASAGCYPLATHAVGEDWMQTDGAGHSYKMWLVKGR